MTVLDLGGGPFIKYDLSVWEALPMRENDCVTFPTDAVCPDCGQKLMSEGKITYAYPFDDLMEAHVQTHVLRCTAQGCGFTRPSQPELLESARGHLGD